MISIIIPTYNEETVITETLERLREAAGDFEVIVVDGASTDASRERVQALEGGFPRRLLLLAAPRSRAVQLSAAARVARGDAFLFLHADAWLPPDGVPALEHALATEDIVGGNFALRFCGPSKWNRAFTWINRARRPFGIYYGDSGIFVRRPVFERLGGFKPIPIMEDYEFVRRLQRAGRTACLAPVLTVSDRRWRRQGVWRTMWSWFWIQLLYSLGVAPERLARWYRPVRVGRVVEKQRALESTRECVAERASVRRDPASL
jgi:rSAM/selenodomain-associated transferase 2